MKIISQLNELFVVLKECNNKINSTFGFSCIELEDCIREVEKCIYYDLDTSSEEWELQIEKIWFKFRTLYFRVCENLIIPRDKLGIFKQVNLTFRGILNKLRGYDTYRKRKLKELKIKEDLHRIHVEHIEAWKKANHI